jgi:hypothetical protein
MAFSSNFGGSGEGSLEKWKLLPRFLLPFGFVDFECRVFTLQRTKTDLVLHQFTFY